MVSSLADRRPPSDVRREKRWATNQMAMEELADGQAQVLPRSDVHARATPTGLRA